MDNKKIEETKNSDSDLSENSLEENYFIDDYSHLRLSYYQCRDLSNVSDSTFEPYVPESESNSAVDAHEDKRRKLLEYFVSQIPDLPHPSRTAASIVATASKMVDKTGALRYENKIEQGKRINDEIIFAPDRRSTLNPKFKYRLTPRLYMEDKKKKFIKWRMEKRLVNN